MKTILLVCNAGMSTSLLVKKMQDVSKDYSGEYEIKAVGLSQVESEVKNKNIDVILIGPQVRFKEKEFKDKFEPETKVATIDMRDYGTVNGKNVFEYALKLMEN